MSEFIEFPKMARLSRRVIVSEKIDGTNACVYIGEDGQFMTGSRTRWITPQDDNFGFSAWAHEHRGELMALGPGRHFGEWWGAGVRRRYGLNEKRFSLFNTERWGGARPACCHVVPVLYDGVFHSDAVADALRALEIEGSAAAPGFYDPEGVCIFHVAANIGFKKTLKKDELAKQESERREKAASQCERL